MARLHVIFDPNNKVMADPNVEQMFGIKSAHLSIPEDVRSVDIYNLARRLAELLLEQV